MVPRVYSCVVAPSTAEGNNQLLVDNSDDKDDVNMNNNNGRQRLVFFAPQESSITEAVEKQLNATQSLTPQMGKKGTGNSGGSGGAGLTSGGHHDPQASTPMSGIKLK